MKNIGDAESLFRSTAYYYARYRVPYPQSVFDSIESRFNLDGTGPLLDIGCGTGQLAVPLSELFESAVAIDASPEMIAEAEAAARKAGRVNIQFHAMRAEDFTAPAGSFKLVSFGQSLHWMDIDSMLAKARTLLAPGGGIAIVGSRSIWGGETAEWEIAVIETVKRWLGEERRAGSGSYGNPRRLFTDSIADAGFINIEQRQLPSSYDVDIPFITGHLYSTSYCNRAMLGDNVEAFERDLRDTLLAIDPSGRFTWEPGANYIFADAP
jgi:SAM-dependent methyltransferase